MSETAFGPTMLPRVLCGTSPFIGASQFGSKAEEWLERFFDHPERMSALFDLFCKSGYPGVHVTGFPSVIEAALLTKERYDLKVVASLLPFKWEENLEQVLVLNPEVVFIHGQITDKFLEKRLDNLKACFETIRSANSFPGLATHDTCHTLKVLQSKEHPLQDEIFGLLLPINKSGLLSGGTTKEMEVLLSTMDTRYPVMGMKTLATGKLPPREALEYVFGIPNVRAAAVGVTEQWQVTQITEIVDSFQEKLGRENSTDVKSHTREI
ncbi:hypothetical protein EU528_08895 [Candidatus Thorarchaeota archaeon]|nr:MAG: hypothetical protein EU528_08895 [Candidatus Thorarchaeota archaeon]